MLLVEQNALAALEIADYAYVLESGHLKMQGPAEELAKNDDIVARLPRRLSAARGRPRCERPTPAAIGAAELPVAGVSRSPETARPRARRSSRRVRDRRFRSVAGGAGRVRRPSGRPTSRRLA